MTKLIFNGFGLDNSTYQQKLITPVDSWLIQTGIKLLQKSSNIVLLIASGEP